MSRHLQLFTLLWVFLSACQATNPDFDATVTAVATPTSIITDTVTAVPEPEAALPAGLIYRSDDGLWLVDADGQPQQLTANPYVNPSPDLARTAIWDQENAIIVVDLAADSEQSFSPENGRISTFFSWADLQTVLVGIWLTPQESEGPNNGHLAALDVISGRFVVLDSERLLNSLPALSPDGESIAYATLAGPILYRADTGPQPFTLAGYTGLEAFSPAVFHSPAWSSDSRRLAWIVSGPDPANPDDTWQTGLLIADLEQQTAQWLHFFTPAAMGAHPPAPVWSPDGQWLALPVNAATAEESGVWLIAADGREERKLGGSNLAAPVWLDNGRLLADAVFHDDGRAGLELFDTTSMTGQVLESLPGLPVPITGNLERATAVSPPIAPPVLSLADYPPAEIPYLVENGDFWLVHTPEEQLFAFAPVAPEYADHIDVDECRFAWTEAVGRFVDPCSGDEWELNGRLNREHSTELWSSRDLDQYAVSVQDGTIFVQLDRLIPGLSIDEPPLDAQHGITVTAVTAEFSASTTLIDTLARVDSIWGMDPTAFPPQQALTYVTFPDSLIDDQGRSTPSTSREGELAVFDSQTGGLQQLMHNYWEPIPTDARVVTATMRIELLNLHRQVELPLDWSAHQAGDVWEADVMLPIGYAAARIQQIEWVKTLGDGRARLRLTIINANPEDFRFTCLHLDISDPWQRDCANFDDELIIMIDVLPERTVSLQMRAWVELRTPFQFVLEVIR